MNGSLALHRSLLYVGRHDKTARVRVYDLDGHERVEGFAFRDEGVGRSEVRGLAVDDDRRVWVADGAASRVRCFSIFGREEEALGVGGAAEVEVPGREVDRAGWLGSPSAVAVAGDGDGARLLVGCAGERRHGVQIFDVPGGYIGSPRSAGDPRGRFRDVSSIDYRPRDGGRPEWLVVAERRGERVQVFRDGEFHFAFSIPLRAGARFEPVAVATLEDRRMVVAIGGAEGGLFLVDPAGRPLRRLAESGEAEGQVSFAGDVVVDEGDVDRSTRVALIDQDGERVQIFTLEGRCYGAFGARA